MRFRTGIATVLSVSLVIIGPGVAGSGWAAESGATSRNAMAATFRGLGDLPGGAVLSEATGVSADGSVVVGKSASSLSAAEAFRWTPGHAMVGLGLVQDALYSAASDVSADGSVVVGTLGAVSNYPDWATGAFRWTAGTGMVALESFFGSPANPPAVSADGSIVVGGGCFQTPYSFLDICFAARWTSGVVTFDFNDPPVNATTYGVSADGSVVVGGIVVGFYGCDCAGWGCGSMHDSFRWTTSEGMTPLGFAPAGCTGNAAGDVSADGQVLILGAWEYPDAGGVWRADTGLVDLGDLPGGYDGSYARALSGDGSVVVGFSWSASGREAFIWDAVNGIRSIRALLVEQHGLDLTGWTLTSATGVSDDGQTIVGTGVDPDGHTEAWMATLPGVDSDGDGVIDYTDACENSNVAETLSIDDCQTGIANTTDEDGCTLADAFATSCPRDAAAHVHGRFAACVARLSADWRAGGRIDRAEEGRMMACAASGAHRLSGRPAPTRVDIDVKPMP